MKKPIPKIIDKNNLFDNYILNSYKHNKNSILKSTVKSMDKRYNDYLDNSNHKPKMLEKRMYTRQNSNKLIETLNSTQRNFSNKKLFLSNSYKKREIICKTNETIKNKISINHTNNFKIDKPESNSKKTYTKHKKLLSVQTNINNYKKSYKINQSNFKNPKNNTEISKQTFNHNKVKDFFSLIDKNKIKNKNNAINNGSINKSFICGDKILNRSMEQRSKYTKFKLNENMKLKLVKTKNNKKGIEKKQIEKKETNNNKPSFLINNNESYTQRNKPPSNIEICQTFSKEENMKEKEKEKCDNDIINKNENVENINNSTHIKNEKSIKINTNYKNYNIKNEYIIPKTSTSKDTKVIFAQKEKGKYKPMTSHSIERYTNLKYNAKDNVNNDNNKNISHYSSSVNYKKKKNTYKGPFINKKKNTFTIGNINHNEMIDIKKSINNYSSKTNSNTNTTKANDIFEVISDIKIKSLNEYEEDKKADKAPSIPNSEINNKPPTTPTETTEVNDKTSDKSKVNNNININININYNNININNNNENNNSINKLNKDCNTENNKNKSITVNNKKQYNNSNKNSNNNSNRASIEKPNLNFNNGVFIEDRDEYNILKETFSKDRFSFRPVNSENNEILTNFQQYNNIVNKNNNINNNNKKNSVNVNKSDKITLGKKEIGKSNVINSSLLKTHITKNNNNNVNIGNNKEMKKEMSKLQKLKKIIKNKQTTNTLKGGTILNKSVELRFKKFNK